jgi:hypothetical protein
MTGKKIPLEHNPESPYDSVNGALAAMKRAAREARKIAYLTETSLVIMKDGKIIHQKIEKKDLE